MTLRKKWNALFLLRNCTVDLYGRENERGRFSYNTLEMMRQLSSSDSLSGYSAANWESRNQTTRTR